jgi:hypothetical protein
MVQNVPQAVPFERKMRCIGVRGRPLDFTDNEEIMELLIGYGATSTLDHLHGDDDEPETITIIHRMNPQVRHRSRSGAILGLACERSLSGTYTASA